MFRCFLALALGGVLGVVLAFLVNLAALLVHCLGGGSRILGVSKVFMLVVF